MTFDDINKLDTLTLFFFKKSFLVKQGRSSPCFERLNTKIVQALFLKKQATLLSFNSQSS